MPRDPRNPSDGDVPDPAEGVNVPASDAPLGDASAGETTGEPAHEEAVVASEYEVRVRRTPRYGRFMVLGGAVFAIAAFIATYSFPQGEGYDRNTVFGFVLLGAVAVGVGLGAIAAIIASAVTKHTERTVVADRIDVRTTDASDDTPELPDLGELPAEAEHDENAVSRQEQAADDRPRDGE